MILVTAPSSASKMIAILSRLRREVPVEAVIRSVELAVVEPFVERRVRFVERLGKGLLPQQLGAGRAWPRNPRSRVSASAHIAW